MKKSRIDKLIFERGLAPSRERAQAYLLAGKVIVNHTKVEKPGTLVPVDSEITIKGQDHPYVSRGGLKIEHALKEFKVDAKHLLCMDIGASTGGFTDCLLQRGAQIVYAIDVGYGQLDWKLCQDSRVVNMERTNFRHLKLEQIGTFLDLIVVDASFISLDLILGNAINFLREGGTMLALIKPQFEAGKMNIQKGGVVTSSKVHQQVIESVSNTARDFGFTVNGVTTSPIEGKKKKNREFLIHLTKPES